MPAPPPKIPRPEPDSQPATLPAERLEAAVSLVRDEIAQVNEVIAGRLDSDIALINTLGSHLIHSGGKRLRPALLLLCARACGCRGADHIPLAAVVTDRGDCRINSR